MNSVLMIPKDRHAREVHMLVVCECCGRLCAGSLGLQYCTLDGVPALRVAVHAFGRWHNVAILERQHIPSAGELRPAAGAAS